MMFVLAAMLFVLLAGGAVMVFSGGMGGAVSQKRVAALARPQARAIKADGSAARKRNMQNAIKDFEKKQAEKKVVLTLRRRLDQAGLAAVTTQTFWIVSASLAGATFLFCLLQQVSLLVMVLAPIATGLGLPRWVLSFLKNRREKKFTEDFASAIDVIVRSVKSGLPTNDALRIVSTEFRDPVGSEFKRLVESMKVGVTLEQALKKMFENMPTPEVSFFGIVMSIQLKTGGNLAEALSNLASVLRDRKRLSGKIKAMSSEAKASAMIIGSLPPGVAFLVYLTSPGYISVLFTERVGNLLLAICVIWMSTGIFVMKKMMNFKR